LRGEIDAEEARTMEHYLLRDGHAARYCIAAEVLGMTVPGSAQSGDRIAPGTGARAVQWRVTG
jgi:hypothetical protein